MTVFGFVLEIRSFVLGYFIGLFVGGALFMYINNISGYEKEKK